ncbi:MAG: PQQ-dependent sugar dehydrogenase, partial [Bacteroidota bacterium]|nr:PQQ-dependent sugar dehydrogenase [Bacteroidota bacterium]
MTYLSSLFISMKHHSKYLILITLLFLLAFSVDAQIKKESSFAKMVGHVFKPALIEATDENISKLKLPKGFSVAPFAKDLNQPRIIKISNNGTVYVTRREDHDLIMLKDTNNDGKADEQKQIWQKEQLHGIDIDGDKMYLITVNDVYVADIKNDGTITEPRVILKDFPGGGQHANRTLGVGPDGKLYISVGSTCNACEETNDENATMVVANTDGTNRKIFASGLRNTIGFDWHPETKDFYGMDHGIDWLGDETQKEELNKIQEGKKYGWPYVFADGKFNPQDEPSDMTYEEYAKSSVEPVLLYDAHSAPMEMLFYEGNMFPKEYKNDAFIALHGSWNRKDPTGYKVVRVTFEDNKPARFKDFLSGFLVNDNKGQFGRVVGLAEHPDGSLFVTDDANG